MTFQVRLTKASKPNLPRLSFDLEKLRDLHFSSSNKWEIRTTHWNEGWGHGHQLNDYHLQYSNDWCSQWVLGKACRWKNPWVTRDVLILCDERRDLKKNHVWNRSSKRIQERKQEDSEGSKGSKEDSTGAQCEEIKTCLNINNIKRAYQLVKDLTSEKQITVDPQLSRIPLGNVLLKNKIFSADGVAA